MSKFSNDERHEIYKNALILIQEGECIYMCDAVNKQYTYIKHPLYPDKYSFPELFEHKPEVIKSNCIGWFNREDKQSRIEVLQKCIEMTK